MRQSKHPCLAFALVCLFAAIHAQASGPRWVTGAPYYYAPPGYPITWYIDQPSYFTDPGDLSPYVNHAAADALVAAAASVWTIPTSRMVLSYGGALAEHVSGANITFSSSGLIFPADVQSSDYLAIPIAVIYDTDGSVTDLMLGNGASSPSNCRTAAVTESVDSIVAAGQIHHAILVLNGRCTGPAPAQQLQLQYQLMRAFGRVLGVGWSQTNDNVFTGTPLPTHNQALYWPIMHPIDIICGPYTYQCLPQPFTLRPDDAASLQLLYPVWPPFTPSAPGKTDTLARASYLYGHVTFPNGQGMQGVNVVVHRLEPFWDTPEGWEIASGVTGYRFRRDAGNPITGSPIATPSNMGTTDSQYEGYYYIFGIPLAYDSEPWQNLVVSTQAINPLYIGPYAVGPYDAGVVSPSGSSSQQIIGVAQPYADKYADFPISDAVSTCNSSIDGTESAPAGTNPQGWWTGALCGYGHTAWSSFAVKSSRTATIEVTALNEQGYATTSKAMPVIGLWNVADPTGTLPTIAATKAAFNTASTGLTSLAVASSSQPQQFRMVIADQRGDGRPDLAYSARIFYADAISPTSVPANGGIVTITGTGFRAGNTVAVNGVLASVTSYTPTSITATVPSLRDLHSTTALTADVTVADRLTGGSTTMAAALTYTAQSSLALISAPSGQVFTGTSAPAAFTVQALQADGVTPIAGQAVTFSATGQVQFNICGAATCTLLTDASGIASTTVTPLAAGAITLSAASAIGTQTASFTAVAHVQTITPLNPTQYIAAGATFSWTPEVTLSDNAASTIGISIHWLNSSGPVALAPSVSIADSQSSASTTALTGSLSDGTTATIAACAWTSICTSFTAIGVGPEQWKLQIVSGAGQSLNATDTFAPIVLQVTDAASHPVAGATVEVHQTLSPWGLPCPDRGRCPIKPVDGASGTTLTSDVNGLVTFTPLEAADSPEVTNVAAATGTQGFVSFTLQKQPD